MSRTSSTSAAISPAVNGNGKRARALLRSRHVRGEPLYGPTGRLELGSPGREELVGARVSLHGARGAGGDAPGAVPVLARGGDVLRDLIRPLGEQIAHIRWNARDPPVAQVPRRSAVGLDVEAERHRPGGGVQTPDHRGRLDVVPEGGAVETLEAARRVEHLHDVGDEDVVMG